MPEGSHSHKIGVSTATIVGVNAMIGAGIFTAPAILATSNVGPAAILTYLFVIISVWFIAQSMAKVASKFPEEGSFYTYTKQWGGHTLGIIAGASYLLGILTAMGLLTQIAGSYLNYLFPSISATILGAIALIVIVILNMMGAALAQLGQRILILCTVFPILATIIMCLFHFDSTLLTKFMPQGIGSVFKAARLVIFGFFGFECAASLFSIVKNPKKNVPRALTYSILIVGTLYILFIGSIIASTPLSLFTSAKVPLAEVLAQVFPGHKWLMIIIHLSMLSAILGTIHSIIWSTSNLIISLCKKLKSKTAQHMLASGLINKKTAVVISGLLTFISFATINNLDLFFYFSAVFIVFSYITSITTLLFDKEEWKSKQNIKTIIGIATSLVIFGFALEGIIKEVIKLMQ